MQNKQRHFTYAPMFRIMAVVFGTISVAMGWEALSQGQLWNSGHNVRVGTENGADRKCVLRFDKGQFPSVKGFWSLTMYDENNFLAANPLNRYTLSERDKFVTNPDGSVDLYLQADSPGKAKEANWLPAVNIFSRF